MMERNVVVVMMMKSRLGGHWSSLILFDAPLLDILGIELREPQDGSRIDSQRHS